MGWAKHSRISFGGLGAWGLNKEDALMQMSARGSVRICCWRIRSVLSPLHLKLKPYL